MMTGRMLRTIAGTTGPGEQTKLKCPNEHADMHEVRLSSNASQVFVVDQCHNCGGIWFDRFELYQAKDGEWQRLDDINADAFRQQTELASDSRQCPRDGTELKRFSDPYFPSGIAVEKCPKCDGFWLNRVEFKKFQEARQLKRPREIVIEPSTTQVQIEGVLAMHEASPLDSPLFKAAQFLSTPLDQTTLEPLESGSGSATPQSVNMAINVLMTLLRLFVFKR